MAEIKQTKQKREVNLNEKNDICVTAHNDFVTLLSGFSELRVASCKLLYFAIAQVLISDQQFYEYELNLNDFVKVTGGKKSTIKNYYRIKDGICEAERIADELMNLKVVLKNESEHEQIHVFDRITYNTEKKSFGWKLGSSMQHYLLDLQNRGNYIHPSLTDFVQLKSVREMQLWHILQSANYMNSRKPKTIDVFQFEISDKQLREWTNTQKVLMRRNNFRERIIMRPIKSISDKLSLDITVIPTDTGHIFTIKNKNYISPLKVNELLKKYPGIQESDLM